MTPEDARRLRHIQNACMEAAAFAQGRSRADLDTDPMFRRAVINALQEIGEASSRVTAEGRLACPGIPWGQIVQTRHILVHVYWGIDLDQVWKTLNEDLAPLEHAVKAALAA
jgi:uncharacterized protein with HEPN domain